MPSPSEPAGVGIDVPARAGREGREHSAPKVSHLVARELRRQILSGELVADQPLATEAALIASFEVSRETLREALRILESQSLVEVRRGRGGGAIVRSPGVGPVGRYLALLLQVRGATLADLEETRGVLEPPLAEQFAVHCNAGDLHELERLLEQEQSSPTGDSPGFVAAAAAFDLAVTERFGNRTVGLLAGIFRHVYAGQIYSAFSRTGGAPAGDVGRLVPACHRAFLDAARRRDGATARKAWAEYLDGTNEVLLPGSSDSRPVDVVPLWRGRVQTRTPAQANRLAAAVADEIRARIAEGRLAEGDRLPGLPALAQEFGVSRPTLREALRILEMEFLLDVRAGDRNGPRVRQPSSQVAAQLAGTVIQARSTTVADFFHAVAMVEPALIECASSRMSPQALAQLERLSDELAVSGHDVPELLRVWTQARRVTFGVTGNPALETIAEILQWVRVGAQAGVTAYAATDTAWLAETHRLAALFAELVDAFEAGDGARAAGIWAQSLNANSPYIESSDLGRRLVIDLMGETEGVPWTSRT